jgi:hypothetical protein
MVFNTAILAHDAVEGASTPSGLVDQSQKMRAAATATAEKKAFG